MLVESFLKDPTTENNMAVPHFPSSAQIWTQPIPDRVRDAGSGLPQFVPVSALIIA